MSKIQDWYAAFESWLSRWFAIILCLVWAVWDFYTAMAYIDGAPRQLATVERIVHAPIWMAWAVAATVLIVGCFIPAYKGGRWRIAAMWVRSTGILINTALLGVWAYEFIFAETDRGWVSGKNYLQSTFFALLSGYLVTRYTLRKG